MPRGAKPKKELRDRLLLRQYREAGISIEQCAECFGISIITANRYLRALRKTMGPEKLPNMQRARWHTSALRARDLSVKNNSSNDGVSDAH